MVSVPGDARGARGGAHLRALESARVGGVAIDAWTPRAAAISPSRRAKRTGCRVSSCSNVFRRKNKAARNLSPGFILLHVSGMNQKLLGALEEVSTSSGPPRPWHHDGRKNGSANRSREAVIVGRYPKRSWSR